NDEGRLALVETICAQRSELFIRKSPATAKPSAETGHSSIVLPYNFPFIDRSIFHCRNNNFRAAFALRDRLIKPVTKS
ncbi:MAG: hypothetical protein IJE66_07750, partial [Akkermansia sp.]|nr:hypothetical protein [Akkermansia sp.]